MIFVLPRTLFLAKPRTVAQDYVFSDMQTAFFPLARVALMIFVLPRTLFLATQLQTVAQDNVAQDYVFSNMQTAFFSLACMFLARCKLLFSL